MRNFLLLAVFAACGLLLCGCVSTQDNSQATSLNASLAALKANLSATQAENAGLSASLAASAADKQACLDSLGRANAEQVRLSQLKSVADDLQALLDIKSEQNARAKYADVNNLACRYYLGSGGFFTGGNTTIPIGCAITLDSYINASVFYMNEVNASKARLRTDLQLLRDLSQTGQVQASAEASVQAVVQPSASPTATPTPTPTPSPTPVPTPSILAG